MCRRTTEIQLCIHFHSFFNNFQGHGIVKEENLQIHYTVEVRAVPNSFVTAQSESVFAAVLNNCAVPV